ncbi:MAG TPA: insulinase family protein, partial [Thermoanaerobaculia bacterium]|nr:insulinase family protein [Thermoanaerobaculia bacterium]
KQIASDVSAFNWTLRDPYPLLVAATALPGKTHDEVEKAIKDTLYEVAANGVTDEEVRRAQQQIEVGVIRSRDGTYPYASSLGESVASTNWKWFLTYVDQINAVTAADVKRVAATYLIPEHATVGWFVPGAGAVKQVAEAPPETSAVPSPRESGEKVAARPDEGRPSSASRKSFADRTTRKVLRNGIIVDVIENHSVPTVAIRGLVFAGDSTSPSGKPAVADLTARMLQRGTKSRTKEQIGALLDNAGATRSYNSNMFETNLSLNGLSRDLPLLIDVLADELKNPAFTNEELAKAKSELKTTILRNDDSTAFRATTRLTQLAFPENHPYRYAGREAMVASADAATAEDLRAFHRQRYVGAGTIIAIVGAVDAKKAIALVEKALGDLPKGGRARVEAERAALSEKAVRDAIRMPGKANMNLIFGSASRLRRSDPDYEAALIANAALGQTALSSRIGRRVRDTEGLSYSLSSRFQMSDMLDGVWLVNVNVAPQNLEKAMRSTMEEIQKFAREGVTEEEVAIQKDFFAGNFQVGLGTNGGVASALVTAEKFGFGPRYLDEFPRRIRAVTLAEVNQAVKTRFFPDRMHTIVAGDLETLPE